MGYDPGLDIPFTQAAASTALNLCSSERGHNYKTAGAAAGARATSAKPCSRRGDHGLSGGEARVHNAAASPPLQRQRPEEGNWNWLT